MLKSLITFIGNSFVCPENRTIESVDEQTSTETDPTYGRLSDYVDTYVNEIEPDPVLSMLNEMIGKDLCKGLAKKKYIHNSDPERRRLQLLNARRKYHRSHKDSPEYKEKQRANAKNYYIENAEKIKQNRKFRYQCSKALKQSLCV